MSETARMVARERRIRAQAEQLFALYAQLYPTLTPDRLQEMSMAEAAYLVDEREAIQRGEEL